MRYGDYNMANQGATFSITDTKIYVPVVALQGYNLILLGP